MQRGQPPQETPTMSDNLRRYRAICHALMQAYPTSPTGHFARHLQTLAALMSGIVGGKSTQLPHIAVVELIREVIPEGAKVVFLGDGEFDGTALQATLNEAGWSYACRTALSTVATWEGVTFRLDTLGACSKPGTLIELKEVQFTRGAYGPVMVLSCWAKGYQEPLYLVSNMDAAEEACRYYQKRFRIETFFSDQKSRGFHLHKSHISDPQRLSRLLIAACLAYIWIVYLGSLCEKEGWREHIHRKKRCDLSLFQLGLRFLEHFLNEELPIPVQFHVTI